MIKERLEPTSKIPYGEKVKYKQLCEIFGIEYKRGNYVIRNITRISNEYNLEKLEDKHYIILNKLDIPRFEKLDNRFCVCYANKNKSGIYIIQLNDTVYIGQTKNFYKRFTTHKGGYSPNNKKTSELLELGATFKIIEIEDNLNERLLKEKYYINKYIKDKYNVVNNHLYDTKIKQIRKNKVKLKKCSEIKHSITFNSSDLDKITKLLSENNIEFNLKTKKNKKETTNVQQ